MVRDHVGFIEINPRRHKVKKSYTKAWGGGWSIGTLTSTFDTIHPIDQIFGTFNESSLYFQLIETTCCLIGFHGNHSNITTSLAAISDRTLSNFHIEGSNSRNFVAMAIKFHRAIA